MYLYRCNGVYSYRDCRPASVLYQCVRKCWNSSMTEKKSQDQLKTEFVSALQPAFAKISELEIRPSAIPGHVKELCDAMNEELTQKWIGNQRSWLLFLSH